MSGWVNVAEVWRGPFLESIHMGRAVVCDSQGDVIASWGDVDAPMLPRSSSKMLQALPLIESGAAAKFGLNAEHLALACASHQGAAIHTDRVTKWLSDLELGEADLRCGPQFPRDRSAWVNLVKSDCLHDRRHNNCSGKHTGFLSLNKHLGGDAEYVDVDHPVQKAVLEAFEAMTGETTSGYGIDGCSAPNFGCSLKGLATAMARMADPSGQSASRQAAANDLVDAMKKHPELVAGEGRACTELMLAMSNKTVIKTGAEGVFIAILPERGLGVAIKAQDGSTRAAECMIASLLVRLGAADAQDPMFQKRSNPVLRNFDGLDVGYIKPADNFAEGGAI